MILSIYISVMNCKIYDFSSELKDGIFEKQNTFLMDAEIK